MRNKPLLIKIWIVAILCAFNVHASPICTNFVPKEQKFLNDLCELNDKTALREFCQANFAGKLSLKANSGHGTSHQLKPSDVLSFVAKSKGPEDQSLLFADAKCQREGLTFVAITLVKLGLKKLPNSVQNLTNLNRLSLAGNSLTDIPSVALGQLQQLEHLDLMMNYGLTILSDGLANAQNLRFVDLSWNENLEYLPNDLTERHNVFIHKRGIPNIPNKY